MKFALPLHITLTDERALERLQASNTRLWDHVEQLNERINTMATFDDDVQAELDALNAAAGEEALKVAALAAEIVGVDAKVIALAQAFRDATNSPATRLSPEQKAAFDAVLAKFELTDAILDQALVNIDKVEADAELPTTPAP